MREVLRPLSPPLRFALIGAMTLGTAGAASGLTVGLFTYAPTAPFALVELGLPSAVLGGVVGCAVGAGVSAARRVRRWHAGP